MTYRHLKKNVAPREVRRLLSKVEADEASVRHTAQRVGKLLMDLAKLSDRIIFPSGSAEISSLVGQAMAAALTGVPIPIFTPFCPDWSRDAQGRYDFKSLGGGVSEIARKVFADAPELLQVFVKHKIPYEGILVFADWGMETEIDAKDTYGRKLTSADVQMCFESTMASTDEALSGLQSGELAHLFATHQIVKMTSLFSDRGLNPQLLYERAYRFFSEGRGKKLSDELHRASLKINKDRFGVEETQNVEMSERNLAEYGTFGCALGKTGIILAAESNTSTKAYNQFRNNEAFPVLPVFFIKGTKKISQGVNIL